MTDPRDLIQRLADALESWQLGCGSTAADTCIIQAARAYLAASDEPAVPDGSEPTDEELMKQACKELGYEYTPQMLSHPVEVIGCLDALPEELVSFARAVLARYGSRTPAPIPIAERQPTEADCDAEGLCWLCGKLDRGWRLISITNTGLPKLTYCFSHWLPHWALPVPGMEA